MDTSNKGEKPKPIADITANIHWSKLKKQDWLEEYLEDHLRCILCGTDLRFDHKTDFLGQTVTEDAHCPNCRVRNRQSTHSLQ